MTTLETTTTKAPAAKKATKQSVKIETFTVTERWVRITATIRADHYPQFSPEANPAMAISSMIENRMVSLSIYTAAAKDDGKRPVALYDISLDAGKWGYNRLGTLNIKSSKEITFRLKECQWQEFVKNCEFIGHPPEAVIRGAFGSRAMGLGRPGMRTGHKNGGEGMTTASIPTAANATAKTKAWFNLSLADHEAFSQVALARRMTLTEFTVSSIAEFVTGHKLGGLKLAPMPDPHSAQNIVFSLDRDVWRKAWDQAEAHGIHVHDLCFRALEFAVVAGRERVSKGGAR
jgi:hypothetical protein